MMDVDDDDDVFDAVMIAFAPDSDSDDGWSSISLCASLPLRLMTGKSADEAIKV